MGAGNEPCERSDHPRVPVAVDAAWQGAADVGVVHHIAHVIQWHLQKPVGRAVVQGRGLGTIEDHQHAPRHQFHAADADSGQIAVTHPGDEALALYARSGFPRKCAVVRWHVVDGEHRDAVPLLDGLELRQQPLAVRLRYLFIALAACIPPAVQRLCRHHLDLALKAWHHFKPPIDNQLDAGKALVQAFDHTHQAVLLGFFVKTAGQPVGIERIQKETPVALFPQGADDPLSKEGRPFGRCLIDHHRVPLTVARHLPWGWKVLEVAARGLDLCHGGVGIQFAALGPVGNGVVTVVRLHHHNVKKLQIFQRRVAAVVQRHGGCRHRRGAESREGQ